MKSNGLVLSGLSFVILVVIIGASMISASASELGSVGVSPYCITPPDDECQYFPAIHRPKKPLNLISIATAYLRPNWILASFAKPEIPRYSTDGGFSWTPVQTAPWTAHPFGNQIVGLVHKGDFSFPPRFIVLVDSEPYQIQNGLYRTGDLGASWSNTTFQIPGPPAPCNTQDVFFTDLYVMPANPMRVYLSGYCYYETGGFPPASTIVYFAKESSDGGVNWFASSMGLAKFAVSPAEPSRVYARPPYYYSADWYLSINAGDTWTPVTFGFSPDILSIGGDKILYTIGKRSENNGSSWISWNVPAECSSPRRVSDLIAHPTINGLLLMRCTGDSTSTKIVRSFDKGNTWSEIVAPAGALLTLDEGNKGRLLGTSDCITNSASQCGGL